MYVAGDESLKIDSSQEAIFKKKSSDVIMYGIFVAMRTFIAPILDALPTFQRVYSINELMDKLNYSAYEEKKRKEDGINIIDGAEEDILSQIKGKIEEWRNKYSYRGRVFGYSMLQLLCTIGSAVLLHYANVQYSYFMATTQTSFMSMAKTAGEKAWTEFQFNLLRYTVFFIGYKAASFFTKGVNDLINLNSRSITREAFIEIYTYNNAELGGKLAHELEPSVKGSLGGLNGHLANAMQHSSSIASQYITLIIRSCLAGVSLLQLMSLEYVAYCVLCNILFKIIYDAVASIRDHYIDKANAAMQQSYNKTYDLTNHIDSIRATNQSQAYSESAKDLNDKTKLAEFYKGVFSLLADLVYVLVEVLSNITAGSFFTGLTAYENNLSAVERSALSSGMLSVTEALNQQGANANVIAALRGQFSRIVKIIDAVVSSDIITKQSVAAKELSEEDKADNIVLKAENFSMYILSEEGKEGAVEKEIDGETKYVRVLFENANFEIKKSDMVRFTAPNGGGKSTLIAYALGSKNSNILVSGDIYRTDDMFVMPSNPHWPAPIGQKESDISSCSQAVIYMLNKYDRSKYGVYKDKNGRVIDDLVTNKHLTMPEDQKRLEEDEKLLDKVKAVIDCLPESFKLPNKNDLGKLDPTERDAIKTRCRKLNQMINMYKKYKDGLTIANLYTCVLRDISWIMLNEMGFDRKFPSPDALDDNKLSSCSAGEKKALGLINIMLKQSEFTVIDETFANIDIQNKSKAMGMCLKYLKNSGILLVSHEDDIVIEALSLLQKNNALGKDDTKLKDEELEILCKALGSCTTPENRHMLDTLKAAIHIIQTKPNVEHNLSGEELMQILQAAKKQVSQPTDNKGKNNSISIEAINSGDPYKSSTGDRDLYRLHITHNATGDHPKTIQKMTIEPEIRSIIDLHSKVVANEYEINAIIQL